MLLVTEHDALGVLLAALGDATATLALRLAAPPPLLQVILPSILMAALQMHGVDFTQSIS